MHRKQRDPNAACSSSGSTLCDLHDRSSSIADFLDLAFGSREHRFEPFEIVCYAIESEGDPVGERTDALDEFLDAIE